MIGKEAGGGWVITQDEWFQLAKQYGVKHGVSLSTARLTNTWTPRQPTETEIDEIMAATPQVPTHLAGPKTPSHGEMVEYQMAYFDDPPVVAPKKELSKAQMQELLAKLQSIPGYGKPYQYFGASPLKDIKPLPWKTEFKASFEPGHLHGIVANWPTKLK